jgi:hypothetical protein
MYICAECAEYDCEGHTDHPQAIACDVFTLDEIEEVTEERSAVALTIDEHTVDIRNLYGTIAILSASIAELERKFDTIISAIVKASSPEEDR